MPSISSKLLVAGAAASLLAGCSSAGPADDALAIATEDHQSTTTMAEPTAAMPPELAFDAEQAEMAADLMETEEGRQLVVETMAAQLGLEIDQAECFVDNTPTEAMAGLADDELTNEEITLFLTVLSTCDIALDDLGIMSDPASFSGFSGTGDDASGVDASGVDASGASVSDADGDDLPD